MSVIADLFAEPAPEKNTGKNNATLYDANDIKVLEGLEPVRMRPGMYIGGTDERAFHHLAAEIIDNSMDEAVAGHANKIEVVLGTDGFLTISDNGRGIPTGMHPKFKDKSALEIIFTTLHSGGKFNGDAYQTSGGLHGVGSSVVNALSEKLIVDVYREKKHYQQTYAQGKVLTPLNLIGDVANKRGTSISFKPDPIIFGDTQYFKPSKLYKLVRSKAFLFKGVKIIWRCDPSLIKDKTPTEEVLHFPNGIKDFLDSELAGIKTITDDVFFGEADFTGAIGKVEWAIVWVNTHHDNFMTSYCNTVPTPLGGTHEHGMRSALTKALKAYAQMRNNKRGDIVTTDDVMCCLCAVLSVFIREPEFQGQTKEKLSSSSASTLVDKVLKDRFESKLAEDTTKADILLEFIIERAEERIRRKKDKDVSRASATKKLRLPGKLADCSQKDKEGTELFLVEGDSAGGSAKQARDRKTQAILPLRGKILNVAGTTIEKMKANQELSDLILAIGCGIGKNFNLDNLRYEKIVIMTDADVDGAHIAALLITFFYRELPKLIEKGHIYLAVPPLYRISSGTTFFYARDDADKDAIIAKEFKNKKNVEIGRFKGLGEMMPKQLRDTTMDRKSRTLIRLNVPRDEKAETDDTVERLMGKRPELRYEFITHNACFAVDLDL
ncbi:MAG: topoisomerase-4 subunit B [Alphaproteobacteria bacterium]